MKYHFILFLQEFVPFPRVTSLLTYSNFGTKGIRMVKNSFCFHDTGMITDKSHAFQIQKPTSQSRLKMNRIVRQ